MTGKPTALLVSNDASLIEAIQGVAATIGNLGLRTTPGVVEAHEELSRGEVSLVLVHQEGEGEGEPEGVARLQRAIVEERRSIPTLVLSNRHRPEHALSLLRSGVADYLCRPLDLSRLAYLMDVLTLRARLSRPENAPVVASTAPCSRVPGSAPAPLSGGEPPPRAGASIGRMMEQVSRVASQDTTILLGGETGTGKSRLARRIHEMSPRRDLPFLVVNCGALSATLIESEMFGHIKGAFTGADRDHVGKFAEVGTGTLFLDEIDALPLTLQAKLLRAVEERMFEPVGSNRSLPMQARLIAASNRPLDHEASAGRFRSDLYYRLNVVSFTLPPLRDRRDMIPQLAGQFMAEFAGRNGRQVDGISVEAMRALQAHHWNGNIRELRNIIERAVVLSLGREIQLEDLPEQFHPVDRALAPHPAAAPAATLVAAPAATLARTKDHAEMVRISDALKRHRNNRLRAAAELGISRMTLYKKLHKYNLMGTTA